MIVLTTQPLTANGSLETKLTLDTYMLLFKISCLNQKLDDMREKGKICNVEYGPELDSFDQRVSSGGMENCSFCSSEPCASSTAESLDERLVSYLSLVHRIPSGIGWLHVMLGNAQAIDIL